MNRRCAPCSGWVASDVSIMIRRLFSSRRGRAAVGVYLILWLLTAILGNKQIDHKFDRDFRYGSATNSDEQVEITRIDTLHVRDLMDPRNASLIPANGLFRYRSTGIAIAPFLVLDEIGVAYASMGGVGAIRASLWLPGYSRSWLLHPYWHI